MLSPSRPGEREGERQLHVPVAVDAEAEESFEADPEPDHLVEPEPEPEPEVALDVKIFSNAVVRAWNTTLGVQLWLMRATEGHRLSPTVRSPPETALVMNTPAIDFTGFTPAS